MTIPHAASRPSPRTQKRQRAGITMVEVVVALILLGVTLMALAGLMVQVGQKGREVGTGVHRNATMIEQINYYSAVPYDSLLMLQGGCTTVTQQRTQFEQCVSITPNGDTRAIAIALTPANTRLAADTVRFERTKPPSPNPFNIP